MQQDIVGATVPGRPLPQPNSQEHPSPSQYESTSRPLRKKNRLQGYNYSQNGAYFVTICAINHKEIFSTIFQEDDGFYVELTPLGKCIESTIEFQHKNGIIIDSYVIMPNHIHMIIVLAQPVGDRGRSPLQYVVRNIKSFVTKWAGFSPWQKSFYDRIIRDEAEYLKIREYIENNPAKWVEDRYNYS
jgi:REP element-mobilizing transposase RayT